MRAIVVGAGIVGISLAFHLAKKGISTSVLDPNRPGGGASFSGFACLNIFGHKSDAYYELRLEALRYHRTLARSLDAEDLLHMCGTLRWSDGKDGRSALDREALRLRERGADCSPVPAEVSLEGLEPSLDLTSVSQRPILVSAEGWLDVVPYLGRLLAAAAATGKFSRIVAKAVDITILPQGVRVSTDEGELEADIVALAAGVACRRLAASLGGSLPVEEHPGVTIVSAPSRFTPRHIIYAPGIHFRADGGGRVLAALAEGHANRPSPSPEEAAEEAAKIMTRLARWMPGFEETPIEAVRIGVRPVPSDSYPIAGYLPGLDRVYAAVYHSGITLAPLLGRLCAEEISSAKTFAALDAYRPQRFATAARA